MKNLFIRSPVHPARLTVIVPTKDRKSILLWALKKNQSLKSPFKFVIVDASKNSDTNFFSEIGGLSFEYLHLPNSSVMEAIGAGVRRCNTPYLTFAGDDDFVLERGADRCMDVLDKDPSIALCSGHGMYTFSGSDGEKSVESSNRLWGWYTHTWRDLMDEDFEKRLVAFIGNYQVLQFAIVRTEVAQSIYDNDTLFKLDTINRYAPEVCVCAALSMKGKFKLLPNVSFVRGVGSHRAENYHTKPSKNLSQKQSLLLTQYSTKYLSEFAKNKSSLEAIKGWLSLKLERLEGQSPPSSQNTWSNRLIRRVRILRYPRLIVAMFVAKRLWA